MSRSVHYFRRYVGHKLFLKEGQDRKYGSRQQTKKELSAMAKNTFTDWLERDDSMEVAKNRLFVRTLYYWDRPNPTDEARAQMGLMLMGDVLHLFDNYKAALAAMNATEEYAAAQGWDHTDERDIARMAKHFYDQGCGAVRGLTDNMQPREA